MDKCNCGQEQVEPFTHDDGCPVWEDYLIEYLEAGYE